MSEKKDTVRVITGRRGFDKQIIKMSPKAWDFWSDRDYASEEVLINYVRDPESREEIIKSLEKDGYFLTAAVEDGEIEQEKETKNFDFLPKRVDVREESACVYYGQGSEKFWIELNDQTIFESPIDLDDLHEQKKITDAEYDHMEENVPLSEEWNASEYADDDGHLYVMDISEDEKGEFNCWEFEVDEGTFDVCKLVVKKLELTGGDKIDGVLYDGKEIDDQGSSGSDAKGCYINFHKDPFIWVPEDDGEDDSW
jgi:hypothetical protein